MNKLLQKPFIKKFLIGLGISILIILLLDLIIIPWYVSSKEVVVPNVIGYHQNEADQVLKKEGFYPVISDTSFVENISKDHIFLQKPEPGKIVKEGRTVYLFISGGEQIVSVPLLKGKSLIDARFALERVGLKLGYVNEVASNYPRDMIFDQQYVEGTPLKKGQSVSVTLSTGSAAGDIIVPDLIGKSLTQARIILNDSSLTVGKINYQISSTLLPNTILDQYPAPGNKLNAGEEVDLFITKTGQIPQSIE
ncbi:MAG TPA: PASTA domain-containing protein [Ignavibacteriaceae bacterium]|nr:PASTA domain-containing protein [Ignavibacteriaceae bacterium]